MLRWLSDKWEFIRYTSVQGWFVHARFWWYTTKRERVVVAAVLIVVTCTVGFAAHHSANTIDERRQMFCLAMNIYHEARGEPLAGKHAVAEVTLNRVKSKHYPNTICKVVHQKGWDKKRKRYVSAFSWTELDYAINVNSKAWLEAMKISEQALNEELDPQLNGALFYHADYVNPRWAKRKKIKARIGKHIFY